MGQDQDKLDREHLRSASAGFELVGAIFLFTLIGYAADRHWECLPYGTLAGAVIGVAVGVYQVMKSEGGLGKARPPDEDPKV